MGANEVLVGLALKDIRDKVVIATKFSVERNSDDNSKDLRLKKLGDIWKIPLEGLVQNILTCITCTG